MPRTTTTAALAPYYGPLPDLKALAAISREIQAIDPAVPLANVRSFENLIGDSVAPRRLSVVLLGVFAAVAVLLAGVGVEKDVVIGVTEADRTG